MSSTPVRGLLVWGSSPVRHTGGESGKIVTREVCAESSVGSRQSVAKLSLAHHTRSQKRVSCRLSATAGRRCHLVRVGARTKARV